MRSQFQTDAKLTRRIREYKATVRKLLVEGFGGMVADYSGGVGNKDRYGDARLASPLSAENIALEAIQKHLRAPRYHLGLGPVSGSTLSPTSGGAQIRQRKSLPGSPASDGATSTELEHRLKDAFKPLGKVQMQTPSDTPAAAYAKAENAAIVYMKPVNMPVSAKDILWLPQEAADWLYQATHCAIPLLQTL